MDTSKLITKLERPNGKIDVVIDTDTFNEIDDQYAIAYAIKSDDKINLKAIYAAPFYAPSMNHKSTSVEDGMMKSYNEIMNILDLMEYDKSSIDILKGSTSFLENEEESVKSPAADDLVKRAMSRDDDNPLYVVALGAITNIASAIIMEPEIINKIVVIWLGGHAHEWPHNKEFNLFQDVAAARIIFGSGVPLIQLPCKGVVSEFITTGPELEYWLKGKNKLCDYLVDVTTKEGLEVNGTKYWSRAIWDVTAVAWLLDDSLMLDRYEHSPIPEYDDQYSFDKRRHFIKYVYSINRDALIKDLFVKLSKN